ncbi:hypothetical protein DVH24_038530 [Malus domestica]|uniref:Uncharacterized protein n=1 Tax=Malus domestica TaxID=3750 RepID=A0A498KA65_MALDO|nr:hypothetical protein DVH24_038530 [Malus domestica]
MVVADPTRESAGALQCAFSCKLILFFVENQNTWRNAFTTLLKIPSIASAAFATMSFEGTVGEDKVCECVQPKIRVRVERLAMEEGRDKACTILHQSDVLGVDTIVGEFSLSPFLFWGKQLRKNELKSNKLQITYVAWRASGEGDRHSGLLDRKYKRTCVAVQKKGLEDGGYLLNSRTHRNFWLLA